MRKHEVSDEELRAMIAQLKKARRWSKSLEERRELLAQRWMLEEEWDRRRPDLVIKRDLKEVRRKLRKIEPKLQKHLPRADQDTLHILSNEFVELLNDTKEQLDMCHTARREEEEAE
jgi:hypothetical protein